MSSGSYALVMCVCVCVCHHIPTLNRVEQDIEMKTLSQIALKLLFLSVTPTI